MVGLLWYSPQGCGIPCPRNPDRSQYSIINFTTFYWQSKGLSEIVWWWVYWWIGGGRVDCIVKCGDWGRMLCDISNVWHISMYYCVMYVFIFFILLYGSIFFYLLLFCIIILYLILFLYDLFCSWRRTSSEHSINKSINLWKTGDTVDIFYFLSGGEAK